MTSKTGAEDTEVFNMKTRRLTGVVSAIAFIVILLLPPMVFTVALGIVGLVMLYECYLVAKISKKVKFAGYLCAIMFMLTAYGCINMPQYSKWDSIIEVVAIFTILVHMILIVKEHSKIKYSEVLSNGFLTVYITISVICIFFIKERFGLLNMLLLFICAWGTDTFAYFGGRFFGKHKLIEHVSPNKTVEGAISGVVGTTILCALYLYFVYDMQILCLVYGAIIGSLGSIFSQIGDLSASAIKRDAQVKDFGKIFPGHGGFLDRFDSVIFIAPIIYVLICALHNGI